MKKTGTKGLEINCPAIRMADYLLPNNQLKNEDQRKVFSTRNQIVKTSSNLTSRESNTSECICQQKI